MAPMRFGRLFAPAAAMIVAFSLAGCASGPLGSHGVDYIPAFDTAPPDASIGGKLAAQVATIGDDLKGSN